VQRLRSSVRLGREDGQVMPIFAAGLLAMLAFTGIVLDGGNLFQNRQSLQNASDAAAIAAALEVAKGTCTPATTGPCATYAGLYAGMNDANPSGNALPTCASLNEQVSDTKPPSTAPGCYVYPYTPPGASSNDYVEVWLTRKISNFFGGILGVGVSTESARAVGAITAGTPPPITFAALDDAASCDKHTLLVKLGGNLVVDSGIYVNSCSAGDAFDIFGGGSISAPKIETNGGWESHNSSSVYVPVGTVCSFPRNAGGTDWHITNATAGYKPTRPGCPDVGIPPITDPFAAFPPVPTLGPGNVGPPVSITKVSRGLNGDAANVARVVTSGANGLAVGDSITVSGVGTFGGGSFDGDYTVASVVNSTTFTYANTGSNVPAITQRQMSGGVVTLTTNAPTTLSPSGPDTAVTVTAINTVFNVVNAAITAFTSGSFSYNSPVGQRTFTVSKEGLTGGTATLTVNSTTGLAAGDTMTISGSGVDPALRGSFVLASAAGTTITYPDPATQTVSVTSRSIAGGTAVTINAAGHTFASGNAVTVNTGDARFDGSYTAGAGSGVGVLKYTLASAPAATVTNKSAAAGTATLTTSTTPPLETGDTVTVPGTPGLAYAAPGGTTVTLTGVNTGAKTFSYTLSTFNVSHANNTTITINSASATGLKTGDVVTVSGFGAAQSCLNKANATITATSATQFTYTDAGCTPGSGGNGKAVLVSAATAVATSANAVLVTTPSLGGSGTVTAPAFIAANTTVTPNGSAILTDAPAVASGGTFTPAWMPTVGVVAKNFPGSPAIPTPDEIPSGTVTLNPGTYYGGICIGAPSGSNCTGTNCKAAGGSTTTIQSYNPLAKLTADVPANSDATGGNATLQVNNTSGISKGDLIAIDDEEMTVTNVDSSTAIDVSREANGTEDAMHTSPTEIKHVVTTKNATAYTPAVTLSAGLTAAQTNVPIKWPGQATVDPVQVNDVIQVGSEDMLVTAETAAAGSKATLTVTRGYFSTTPATHANGAAVLNASSGAVASVTLTSGVYIMAGGGFSVCGAASVSAPHVMIYNTNDSRHNSGNGVLGQVDINTSGNVHIGPMTTGFYSGMTIFQDRNLTLAGGACDGKSGNATQWDIALQSAAPLPVSGELGSVSGTIYAPNYGSDFGDSMSGTGNLAVITSCIYINGANAHFTHSGNGFAGPATATLGG
jgi:hypothetical protein